MKIVEEVKKTVEKKKRKNEDKEENLFALNLQQDNLFLYKLLQHMVSYKNIEIKIGLNAFLIFLFSIISYKKNGFI